MNKHTFTTVKDEEPRRFVSEIINSHSFVSRITSSRIYTAIIDGFHVSATWIGKFDSNLRIVVSAIKANVKIGATVIIAPILIVVDYTQTTLALKPIITIASNLTILPIFKMLQKMGIATISLSSSIIIRFKSIMRALVNTLNIPAITITATGSCRQYYKVSDWDGELLSTLDTKTLQTMDYQEV
jgi:hypothetical protein